MLDDEQQFVVRRRQRLLRLQDLVEVQIIRIGHAPLQIHLRALLGRIIGTGHVTRAFCRYFGASQQRLAITSARRDVALPPDLIVLGEIGLAGEIRRVAGVERRLAEAARLGFTSALVPPDSGVKRGDLRVQEVGDVALVLDNLR